MKELFNSLVLTGALTLLCCNAHAQSFTVGTAVTKAVNQYSYTFTLKYDQAGAAQSLTAPIYD